MWFFHNPGLLGINARNLLYIRAYNPEKAIMLADSKIKTKNYLSARGIPVAKLYASIDEKKELRKFDWGSLPASFVIKPNSGFGGEGIIIIYNRKGKNYINNNGEQIPQRELENHVNDILDGRYSISDVRDTALFEQLLIAPEPFSKMSYQGLPDIRVVVHNLIPVMAMLRIPTKVSQGKANIHLGGIAAGIDIAKGVITHTTQHNKIISSIPGYGDITGMKIPFWEEILLIASRVQYITNLGFGAIDIALDKNMGPVLLEINARSGLAVQIANMAPLRRRLERIEGIKVGTPEKGVRIAQDIFGEKVETKQQEGVKNKIIIGQAEPVEIFGEKKNKKILAKMDLDLEKTVLDRSVADETGLSADSKCKFNLSDQRITTVVEIADMDGKKHKMLIGSRDLKNFLIDTDKPVTFMPESAEAKNAPLVKRKFTAEELHKIDDEIVKIDSEIHLLSHLRPENLQEEQEKFLRDKNYNPRFTYKPLNFNPLNIYKKLDRMEFPEKAVGILLRKKADEIRRKIELLEARGKPDFTAASVRLYGAPEQDLLRLAIKEVSGMPFEFPGPKKEYSAKDAARAFEKKLKEFGLEGWQVIIKEEMVSDAVAGKDNSILIRADAVFSEERLKGLIAHEIETHVFTAMNGSLQPWKIFRRGLADYLLTEEGLAIYNQEKTETSETPKKYWAASSVIGLDISIQGGFSDVYAEVLKYGFDEKRALRVALKVKRGLTDTSRPGAFTKDVIYFKGREMIREFARGGGDLKELYIGKTSLPDLEIIRKVSGLKKPLWLPKYLQT